MSLPPFAFTASLFAALCGSGISAAAQEAFFEPFDTLDRGRWMRSDGWSNGDWMNCDWSRDAARVTDGVLTLEVRQGPGGLICGELQSTATYGYGTYEVRMRTGAGSGLNAAFFTYIGPVHGRAHHEIDIEVLLRTRACHLQHLFRRRALQWWGRAACFGQRRGVPELRLHLGARWHHLVRERHANPPHGARRADPRAAAENLHQPLEQREFSRLDGPL
jgi:hypothetical protein